ncbi:unnamed protein product [Candida verbasci]|uniref:Uncharacterized protein n=1 Tax=Candida verbasci TaxID=1227364 RepID=A0A9W4TW24_9ASCO|nr:unnamed protein product [Candida verbasci]
MVSFKSLILLSSVALNVQCFSLLHDIEGFAILPPTDLVLEHLKTVGKTESKTHYDVVNTVNKDDGEIIQVNLHSHEVKKTGQYKQNYDNSCYHEQTGKRFLFGRTIEDSNLNQCFNSEYDLDSSQCGFDFIEYNDASNCSSDATKYSCVLDVMKQQDATKKLKDMDDVPAQVRCYHSLNQAQKIDAKDGACAK